MSGVWGGFSLSARLFDWRRSAILWFVIAICCGSFFPASMFVPVDVGILFIVTGSLLQPALAYFLGHACHSNAICWLALGTTWIMQMVGALIVAPISPIAQKYGPFAPLLYWLVGIATLLLSIPALKAGMTVREKRQNSFSEKLCANCEYNLTGNTSGRCPECGRAVVDVSMDVRN